MPKLRELEAELYRVIDAKTFESVSAMAEAQGVCFLCPLCFQKNGGNAGTHSVLVWFKDRGVPEAVEPIRRWSATGNSIDDLSLSPSINLDTDENDETGCNWHGYVTNGDAK